MFQMFPFFLATATALPQLPIEVWSVILRKLDPLSLLTAIRTNPFWLHVSKGDKILRRNIRKGLKEEKVNMVQILNNPGRTTKISRLNEEVVFGRNVQKNVTREARVHRLELLMENNRSRNELAKQLAVLDTKPLQKKGGGPLKKKSIIQSRPYKPMRN